MQPPLKLCVSLSANLYHLLSARLPVLPQPYPDMQNRSNACITALCYAIPLPSRAALLAHLIFTRATVQFPTVQFRRLANHRVSPLFFPTAFLVRAEHYSAVPFAFDAFRAVTIPLRFIARPLCTNPTRYHSPLNPSSAVPSSSVQVRRIVFSRHCVTEQFRRGS